MQLARIKYSAAVFISLFCTDAYPQEQSLIAVSKSLAFEMGQTYQRARNCNQHLANIEHPQATALFQNYFSTHDVKRIMRRFEHAVAQQKDKSCNLESIQTFKLMNQMGQFMRLAGSKTTE